MKKTFVKMGKERISISKIQALLMNAIFWNGKIN